jgi:hypothetical protein
MTKLFTPGDKSRAICPHCAKLVTTTFSYRDVPFDDNAGTAQNILAAVCDECNKVVAIPAQSTPAIKKARAPAEIPLEVILTAPEVEILDAAAYEIDPQATTRFRKAIFTYYLGRLERDAEGLELVKTELNQWLIEREHKSSGDVKIPNRRLSFKLAPRTQEKITVLLRKTGWGKTNLVRSVIMMVEKDILQDKSKIRFQALRDVADVVNA